MKPAKKRRTAQEADGTALKTMLAQSGHPTSKPMVPTVRESDLAVAISLASPIDKSAVAMGIETLREYCGEYATDDPLLFTALRERVAAIAAIIEDPRLAKWITIQGRRIIVQPRLLRVFATAHLHYRASFDVTTLVKAAADSAHPVAL